MSDDRKERARKSALMSMLRLQERFKVARAAALARVDRRNISDEERARRSAMMKQLYLRPDFRAARQAALAKIVRRGKKQLPEMTDAQRKVYKKLRAHGHDRASALRAIFGEAR